MNRASIADADAKWSRRLSLTDSGAWIRRGASLLAHSADSWFWFVGFGLIWLLGNESVKIWSLALALSILFTAVLVTGLKFTIRRQRPEGEWGGIYRATDPHSFPSGHAARAGLLAALILFWGPLWLTPFIILWAPLVGVARIGLGVHYPSDIAAGLVLGVVIGLIIAGVFPL